MSITKKRVTGFLTKDDMETLRDAYERKLKHKKVFILKSICKSCDYSWFYNSIKCPSCMSKEISTTK